MRRFSGLRLQVAYPGTLGITTDKGQQNNYPLVLDAPTESYETMLLRWQTGVFEVDAPPPTESEGMIQGFPVIVVLTGGIPVTQLNYPGSAGSGPDGPVATVSANGYGLKITLVDEGGIPVNLFNLNGTPYNSGRSIQQILGDDLLGYYDAERPQDITQSGGTVSAWRDSISGISLTQATSLAQPAYSATSFNGRPAVSTDGIQQFLNFTPGVPYPLASAESEIWVLGSQNTLGSVTSVTSIFGYGNSNAGAGRSFSRVGVSGANRARLSSGSGGATMVLQASTTEATGRVLLRGSFLADVARLEVNGLVEAEVEAPLGGTATTRVRAGASLATTANGFTAFAFNKIVITKPLSVEKSVLLRNYLASLGAITLVSPFVEPINPALWATVTDDPYTYDNVTYHNDSALKSYSLNKSIQDPDLFRMEVREGDRWFGDEGKPAKYNRAELGSYTRPEGSDASSNYHPYGQVEWYSFAMKARNVSAAGNRNMFQLFNDDVEFQLASTATGITLTTYTYVDGARVGTIRYTGSPLVENVPENFVVKALRIPVGGELSVWRNGALMYSVTGIPFGTAVAQKRHKFGAYRVETPPTFVCEHFKLRFGSDLSSKILNPDPWPALWS